MPSRLVFVVTLLLLLVCPPSVPADEIFRFAVFCDSRGKVGTEKCSDSNYGIAPTLEVMVQDILSRSKTLPIKMVLFPGDMIPGLLKRDAPSVAECNRASLLRWREMVQPLVEAGIMLRVTTGNHEAMALDSLHPGFRCGDHGKPYLPSLENFRVFTEVLGDMIEGKPGPASDLGLTYSFDAGTSHFVVLNAYTMFENNSFSNETIAWLDQDLAKASNAGLKIFVASHPPAFPGGGHTWDSLPFFDPSYNCQGYDGRFGIDRRRERDRFWNLLKKHKVVAYFCGHEHNIQVQEVEGVWHVVSGGLATTLYPLNGSASDTRRNTILYDGEFQNPRAAVLWPWDDSQRSYWGWSLVTVGPDKISLDVIGSEHLPTKTTDLKLLKSFVLQYRAY